MVLANQDTIAKRLGSESFDEWSLYRQKQLKKGKTATFQTFCDWMEVRALALPARGTEKQTQSRESGDRQNTYQQTKARYPQTQGQREQYSRYQTNAQSRPQATPGAPAYCAWCRENDRQDKHSTKDCKLFKEAGTAAQWTVLSRQGFCFLCLNGKHRLPICSELRGTQSKCEKCN